jgi:hypothetical protein
MLLETIVIVCIFVTVQYLVYMFNINKKYCNIAITCFMFLLPGHVNSVTKEQKL